jgi:hypothetical protein
LEWPANLIEIFAAHFFYQSRPELINEINHFSSDFTLVCSSRAYHHMHN